MTGLANAMRVSLGSRRPQIPPLPAAIQACDHTHPHCHLIHKVQARSSHWNKNIEAINRSNTCFKYQETNERRTLAAAVFAGHTSQRKTAEGMIWHERGLGGMRALLCEGKVGDGQTACPQPRSRCPQGILTPHIMGAPLKEPCSAKKQNRAPGPEWAEAEEAQRPCTEGWMSLLTLLQPPLATPAATTHPSPCLSLGHGFLFTTQL